MGFKPHYVAKRATCAGALYAIYFTDGRIYGIVMNYIQERHRNVVKIVT
jgi:hypothetical protein